tara:strand:- start:2727 stop:3674 length:948 start_codon:yes stop_codon:yes gene_type:complete
MRAIMYHYVREYDSSLPNFKFLEVQNFKEQLDWFENEFGFVSQKEFTQIIMKQKPITNHGQIVLTFDDGFLDHYQYVYPELLNRGLWGIFYVPTGPYYSNKILDVHRIQLLCAIVPGKDLLSQTLSLVSEDMLDEWKVKEFKTNGTRGFRYHKRNEITLEGIMEVKLILNYYIKPQHKESIIDHLCSIFDVKFDASNYYLNSDQIKEMSQNGMVFGSHTVNHNVMSTLSRSEQTTEIQESFEYLNQYINQEYKTYCHPYGRPNSFDQHTLDILDKNNVHFSFSVNSKTIQQSDMETNLQSLPRFDCNEFPYGLAN